MQPAIPTGHPYPYPSEIEALKIKRARILLQPKFGYPDRRKELQALTTRLLQEELRNE
ncbi:hypothetical protein SAMN06265368_4796 [Cohaesibacter gelatinilyticus]|uniref:Uncharacterized protein n=1 Tax=Cohaesibacter gelatinilyticus TaxID=372072 RepID=A0A285PP21_9HYPH|nr:hypothetical protein SAMN06265368_4796 [Cohaesibacter gelatinilyticus]